MAKNVNTWVRTAMCAALLCAILAGCRTVEPATTGEPTTQPAGLSPSTTPTQATEPTKPTIPDNGIRAVRLMTEGGFPIVDTHIAVYADETLSQHLTTIHTDSSGSATYMGEPGEICYMVPDDRIASDGFVLAPYYTVTDAYTELVVEMALLSYDYQVKPGEVMSEIADTDWNGNQFLLSDRIKEGKPCIIWCVTDRNDDYEPQMALLQKIYQEYGDKLEILLYTRKDCQLVAQNSAQKLGITFPAISAGSENPRWLNVTDEWMIIDRYGMVALEQSGKLDEKTLRVIAEYFTGENYRQDRAFANRLELLDHIDYLKAGEDATYQVKVVDRNGKPQSDVRLEVSYAYRTFWVTTDEQGVANWVLYLRDDMKVEFNRNVHDQRIYIMENEGFFEPGVTEKTLVMQERDKVSYTVKVVDTAGNPVSSMCIRIHPYEKVLWVDENGMIQWESVEMEEPFTAGETVPDGYLYGGITREGNVFTVLMYPIVTYYIKVVDENGNPVDGVWVDFYEEGNEEIVVNGLTYTDGVAKVYGRAGKLYVKLYSTVFIDGTWYELRYGTFELEEGVTEYTFAVGEPETVKLY